MEATRLTKDEEVNQVNGTQTNGAHTNGRVPVTYPTKRSHRSTMPQAGRKQDFEEALPQLIKQHDGALRRLAE